MSAPDGFLCCTRVQFPCNFLFLMWLSLPVLCTSTWFFIFMTLDLSAAFNTVISCCDTWSSSVQKAHILLQELQAVALMLCKMAFWLSSQVVALHLDRSTTKAYLYSQGGTASLFLSWLVCYIFILADQQGITLIPAYIAAHLNVEADYLLGSVGSWVAPGSLHSSGCISSLSSTGDGSVGILTYQSVSVLLCPGRSSTSRGAWGWTLSTITRLIRWVMCFLLQL